MKPAPIEIVYFTTRNAMNQTKTFDSASQFRSWLKQNADILMDFTLMRQPKGYNLPLHYDDAGEFLKR
jgi:hypothetical protein